VTTEGYYPCNRRTILFWIVGGGKGWVNKKKAQFILEELNKNQA